MQLILLSTFLLSLKGIFAKLAYANGATVDATLFYRFLFSIPLVWGFYIYRQKFTSLKNTNLKQLSFIAILSFSGYYLGSKADYIALNLIGAGISRIILFTYPIFVVLFNSIIEKSPPSKTQIITMALCQIGLLLSLGGFNTDIINLNLQGAIFAILSAISYATYIVMISQKGKNIGSQFLITIVMTYAFIFMSIDFFSTNSIAELNMSPKAIFWIIIMAIFSTALPLTLFAESVKKIGGNNTALISTIGPVFTIVISYVIFQETFTLTQTSGVALILTSIFYLNKKTTHNK